MKEFKNEPLVDFTATENRERMQEAIGQIRGMAEKTWPLVIGGKEVETSETFQSFNPANTEEVLSTFAKAGEAEAQQALEAAWIAFETWKHTLAGDRAAILFNASKILHDRRFLMNAAMVLEAGKSWIEADADTAEAIDFLEFYAREAIRYAGPQPLTAIPTEKGELRYIPLGAGIAIPPWNFPCAILSGITTGPMVAGNTMVLKPASDTPLVANLSFQLLVDAGMPAGVVNLLTGPGPIAGEYLVKNPKTRFITFTGSRDVGLRINELAAKSQDGQIWIKRLIAEMGGKDAIIVDSDCNLDAAAAGVAASAFSFGGQKCSACSRVIVLNEVHDAFMEKLLASTRAIKMGDPTDPDTYLGPVINGASAKKIEKYIEIGKTEGDLVTGGNRAEGPGFFIEPTIFDGIAPNARLAQEEIFGPVLAVIRAKDFSDALEIANNTQYGLTGAVYSNNHLHLDLAGDQFHVGNLYYNRKCTGALVDVHPFGGFNMSGTDSKAGGRDYLLLFLQAKSISEFIG